jgi:hypothetical protein
LIQREGCSLEVFEAWFTGEVRRHWGIAQRLGRTDVCLKFYDVCSAFGRYFDELQRIAKASVMYGTYFRDCYHIFLSAVVRYFIHFRNQTCQAEITPGASTSN